MERSVNTTQFEASCIHLMNEVAATRTPLLINKNGKPVAVLSPASPKRPKHPRLFGRLAGAAIIKGDIVIGARSQWDVES